jgi:CDP-glucose 4,6-dehydratase
VFITSDKAYRNKEWVWGYRENDILGGDDPYSASKGMAELALSSYHHLNGKVKKNRNLQFAVARAGNVIGGGDWAKNRLVPDAMVAAANRQPVKIRNPNSTRPWQHVLEPVFGYLNLFCRLVSNPNLGGEAFNFGPSAEYDLTVKDVLGKMQKTWSNMEINILEEQYLPEAGLLKLNCDKANALLGWKPSLGIDDTIELTVQWYRKFYECNKFDPSVGLENDINYYLERYALSRKI